MARLPVYEVDNTITAGDKLIGTDVNGNGTKNFTVGELQDFIEAGINVLLKVPHGYVPTVDQDNKDWAVSGLRQDLTQLDTTIYFYPSNTNNVAEHANINKGRFSLVAEGSEWFMEIEEYIGRYYLYSFIGKTIYGVWGVSNTPLSFTIDSIAKDGDTDWRVDDDNNRIWRFNITRLAPEDWGALTEVQPVYSEVQVRTQDNPDGTLQLATIYFQSDADMQKVHIDELDADLIVFDNVNDQGIDEEGIRFGAKDNPFYTDLVLTQTGNLKVFSSMDQAFQIEAPVTMDDTLYVEGNTTLDGTLDVNDISTFHQDVHFQENATLLGHNNFIDFKEKLNRVANVDNFENVIITKDGISKRDHDNNEFDITYVLANETRSRQDENDNTVTPTERGSLESIQIGDNVWKIPTSVSQVAQILPGFGEGLSGPDDAITTGTFFYGTDEGIFAEWQSTPSGQPTAQSIPAGNTAIVVPSADRAAFNTLWNNLDLAAQSGQRLFFLDSTESLPSDISQGDQVAGDVYEVVSYVNDTGNLTFSLVGAGTIFISAPNFELQNLSNDLDEETILVLNDDNHVRRKEFSDIAGIAATANYRDTNNSNSFGTLKQILFEGDNYVQADGSGGKVTVDVTGRIPFEEGVRTDSFIAEPWYTYVLDVISEAKTITLPNSDGLTHGDTVRFLNVSDLDSNGAQSNTSELWSVTVSGTSDRIMKLTNADSTIVLDEANSVDFIWSGVASIGWIIK